MRARTTIALGLLLTLAALLPWARPGADEHAPAELTRTSVSPDAHPALEASLPSTSEQSPPTLLGRTTHRSTAQVARGVRVIVHSQAGIRVPGAGVTAAWLDERGEAQTIEAVTSADGSAFLFDVPLDGSATVVVRPSAKGKPAKGAAELHVTDAELVVTIAEGLPLRVRCVDDLTGSPVRDAVVRGATPRPSVDDGFPKGEGWVLALVGPDQRAAVEFCVEAPAGFVAWDPQLCEVGIGAWTRELELVYPLRHEADVRVSVLDHEGRPAENAEIENITVAGVSVSPPETEPLGPGVLRLRGVPLFRHVPLTVVALTREPFARARAEVELPAHPAGRTEVRIRLPRPSLRQRGGRRNLRMGGGAGGGIRGRRLGRAMGSAVIEVLRSDGSPATRVRVDVAGRTARTDDAGQARFTGLPVGEHDVIVRANGLLPLSDWVCVTADREVRLLLREPEGGAIDVHVTDARGDPLPFAALRVRAPSKSAWVDEQGGRQRVDPFTDHWGHRRVEGVEAGRISIRAAWGGRASEKHVDVSEGRVAEVTLVLR